MKRTYCDVTEEEIPAGHCAVEHPIAVRIRREGKEGVTVRVVAGVGEEKRPLGLTEAISCLGKGNLTDITVLSLIIGEVCKRQGLDPFNAESYDRIYEKVIEKAFGVGGGHPNSWMTTWEAIVATSTDFSVLFDPLGMECTACHTPLIWGTGEGSFNDHEKSERALEFVKEHKDCKAPLPYHTSEGFEHIRPLSTGGIECVCSERLETSSSAAETRDWVKSHAGHASG